MRRRNMPDTTAPSKGHASSDDAGASRSACQGGGSTSLPAATDVTCRLAGALVFCLLAAGPAVPLRHAVMMCKHACAACEGNRATGRSTCERVMDAHLDEATSSDSDSVAVCATHGLLGLPLPRTRSASAAETQSTSHARRASVTCAPVRPAPPTGCRRLGAAEPPGADSRREDATTGVARRRPSGSGTVNSCPRENSLLGTVATGTARLQRVHTCACDSTRTSPRVCAIALAERTACAVFGQKFVRCSQRVPLARALAMTSVSPPPQALDVRAAAELRRRRVLEAGEERLRKITSRLRADDTAAAHTSGAAALHTPGAGAGSTCCASWPLLRPLALT